MPPPVLLFEEEGEEEEEQLQLFPSHIQLFGGLQLVLQSQLLPLHIQLFPVEATIAANPPLSFPSLLSSRGLKSLLSSNFNDFFRCFIKFVFKMLHIGFQKEIHSISYNFCLIDIRIVTDASGLALCLNLYLATTPMTERIYPAGHAGLIPIL